MNLPLALVCVASLGFASPALAQTGTRLNGPLPYGVLGDVTTDQSERLTLSPDSAWIVYRADGESENVLELYSVPTAGGPVRQLSTVTFLQDDVDGYAITADSSRVVYLVDEDAPPFTNRLYSVPIDGSSEAVELAPSHPGISAFFLDQASSKVIFNDGTDICVVPVDGSSAPTVLIDCRIGPANFEYPFFGLTPDGGLAVFHSVSASFTTELFSQPSDGSSPMLRLCAPILAPRHGLLRFRIHPSGTKVVYLADQDTPGVYELYVAPIDASAAPVKLNGPIVAGGDVGGPLGIDFDFDPTGTRVVYMADQSSDGMNELYSSDLVSAASNVKLNGALLAGGNVTSFEISASGGRVLYRANPLTASDFGVFSAPIDGSAAPLALYAPAGENAGAFVSSADESVVVLETVAGGSRSLQRVPFGGGPAVRLSPLGLNLSTGFALLPDLGSALFRANAPPSFAEQLYAVPMDGSQAVTQLNVAHGQSEVDAFAVAPDGSLAIYLSDQEEINRDELYSVPPDGSSPATKVSGMLALTPTPLGDVMEFLITADGSHAVYQADQDENDAPELYSVSTTGAQPPLRLNSPLVDGGGVYFDFLLTSDSQSAVYRSVQDGPNTELYSVRLDHATAALKLSGPMVAGGGVAYPFYLTPDETRVLYQADPSVDGVRELFSTPIDGSAAPIRLHAPLGGVEDVFEWLPSADGARAVFSANLDADDTVELYSAPIDGSSSPLELNGPMATGGDVFLGLRVGAGRAVYGADQDTNDVVEIFSAPVDGSGPALKLNGALVANGDVVASAISDDGGTVLYLADQTTDELFELYGVPVDGSSAAVRLNGTLVPAGDVAEATVGPGGQWVAYRADQLVNNRIELFAVPSDGSAPAVRLSPTTTFSVPSGIKFTPDGGRVLFLDRVSGVDNLYSAPVDGSAPALRLNPALPGGRAVTAFDVDSYGRVLYVADQAVLGRFELYRVPADGSETAKRVNRPFGSTAGIAEAALTPSFAFTPTGDEVLYRADQEADETFELFASFLEKSQKRSATAPGPLVEVQALEVSHGQPPLSPARLRAATLSYLEGGRGVAREPGAFQNHEDLARLGVHPALQVRTDGMTYAR